MTVHKSKGAEFLGSDPAGAKVDDTFSRKRWKFYGDGTRIAASVCLCANREEGRIRRLLFTVSSKGKSGGGRAEEEVRILYVALLTVPSTGRDRTVKDLDSPGRGTVRNGQLSDMVWHRRN